ncbi:MAG: FAD:protein FMN transferase [Dehalococcoidia bacterium]
MGRWPFRAMNTDVTLFTGDWPGPELLQAAEAVFHEIEARFSRFRPDSELSRLNARAGEEVAVSPELFRLLKLSERYHEISGGLFEPAVLPSLEAAGYDRSFEQVPASAAGGPSLGPTIRGSIADACLDAEHSTVRVPAGLRIDLGGIGKGWAVDEAARALTPAVHYLVDAGGDIFASGYGPDGEGWLVGVSDPQRAGEDLTTVRLHNQALATSTVARRRWQREGRWLHHLIDPRTGEPVENDVISVSVVAPSAVQADVFAKVALLLGREAGERFLSDQGAGGLFVLGDRTWETTEHWPGGLS